MPVVLFRVDDRLVHGQVIVGWGRPLAVERIILVDDAVAASPWEADLYRLAVPPSMVLEVVSTADAGAHVRGWEADARRTIVVTGDIPSMQALRAAGHDVVREVNIGGLHLQPGRTERLPFVFLTDAEFLALEAMAAEGVRVRAQDVPTATAVGLSALGR